MLLTIKRFFEKNLSLTESAGRNDSHHRQQLASAALLFELMKTDMHIDEKETQTLARVLGKTFDLNDCELQNIIRLAEIESHQSTSLYEFTSLINAGYSYEQRVQLLENLWYIAFADAALDRYEEHLIRKIADLIYVNHSDFIGTKLKVKQELEGAKS